LRIMFYKLFLFYNICYLNSIRDKCENIGGPARSTEAWKEHLYFVTRRGQNSISKWCTKSTHNRATYFLVFSQTSRVHITHL
jgi:hypothetical protein